jgi:hypothetical protein
MNIETRNNTDDVVSIEESLRNGKRHVYLKIGKPTDDDTRSRHAHLRAAEARAIGYALLAYAERISTWDANT